jgi:hypothetical protein
MVYMVKWLDVNQVVVMATVQVDVQGDDGLGMRGPKYSLG